MSKTIQSGGSFGTWLANLGKEALTNVAIPVARNNLPKLVSYLASNAIKKFERIPVRAGKELLISIRT